MAMSIRYLFVIIIFWAADVHAKDTSHYYITLGAGTAKVNGNDYDQSNTGYARIGVRLRHESLTAGYVDLGRFDYRHRPNTDFKARGYTLSVDKFFKFDKKTGLNIKAGMCVWRTDSSFLGSDLGEDNGTGTFIGFAPRLRFNPHVSAFLGLERYFDINGADITIADLGLVLDL